MVSFSACSFLISAWTCRSAALALSASLPAVSRSLLSSATSFSRRFFF